MRPLFHGKCNPRKNRVGIMDGNRLAQTSLVILLRNPCALVSGNITHLVRQGLLASLSWLPKHRINDPATPSKPSSAIRLPAAQCLLIEPF